MVRVVKPGTRLGTGNGQFVRRIPIELIDKAKGRPHTFWFPATKGARAKKIDIVATDKIAHTLSSKIPSVIEERMLLAEIHFKKFCADAMNDAPILDQSVINEFAENVFKLTKLYDDNGIPNLKLTMSYLMDLDSESTERLSPLLKRFQDKSHVREIDFLVDWWRLERNVKLSQRDHARLVEATASLVRQTSARIGSNAGKLDFLKNSAHKYTITELFEHWRDLDKDRKNNSSKAWKTVVNNLIKFLGHDIADDVTESDLSRWKLTFAEHVSTFNRTNLFAVRRLFNIAAEKGWIRKNPTLNLIPLDEDGEDEGRRGYFEREVISILSKVRNDNDSARRWIPMLVGFTGARVREIGQLHSSQVGPDKEFPEIWSIHISDRLPFQELKVDNTRHTVPLHPSYFTQEFRDFVKSREGKYLFADPDPERTYKTSPFQPAMDRSRRWIQSVFKDDDPPSPHHGFRHFFKTKALRITTDHDIVQYIQGHEREYSKKRYRQINQRDCLDVIELVFKDMDFTPSKAIETQTDAADDAPSNTE